MKIRIRNMVCNRCIMVVKDEFEKAGIFPVKVELGEVELDAVPAEETLLQLDTRLQELGFERIDDRRLALSEQIRTLIIRLVHEQDGKLSENLSAYLSSRLPYDYKYLSALFSETEGTSIEKYFIAQKTERVKELLAYDELSLSEIAFRLHYSSVAHLSNQFKKVTGITPGHFRSNGRRKALDEV